jgi:hypothetical protein
MGGDPPCPSERGRRKYGAWPAIAGMSLFVAARRTSLPFERHWVETWIWVAGEPEPNGVDDLALLSRMGPNYEAAGLEFSGFESGYPCEVHEDGTITLI